MNESFELVSRLKPIRLPSEFASFGLQDCLTVFGLGLLIGLAAIVVSRLIVAREPRREDRVQAVLTALRSSPADVRLLQLARLHAELDPGGERPPWRDALYRHDVELDFVEIESDILRAARGQVN